jgi:hypothetical protein
METLLISDPDHLLLRFLLSYRPFQLGARGLMSGGPPFDRGGLLPASEESQSKSDGGTDAGDYRGPDQRSVRGHPPEH